MSSSDLRRLDWIDTLRGIAVLFVFGLHSMLDVQRHVVATGQSVTGLDFFEGITFGWLDFGKIGVGIFFIVSGFLIPVTLDKSERGIVHRFVINRFFRLYPAYWFSIAALLVTLGTTLSLGQTLANLSMLQRFIGIPDLNGVFWTLQIELIFYAACVLLKLAGRLGNVRTMISLVGMIGLFGILIAAVRYQTAIKLPVALLLALQLMFFGYLYRLWLFGAAVTKRQLLTTLAVVMLTFAIACPLAYSRDYGLGERWQRYLLSYCVALLIFALVSMSSFRNSVLAFVGRISYSFYLLHTICLGVLIAAVTGFALPFDSGMHLLLYVSSALALSTLASWFCFRLIEEPGIRLGRKIVNAMSASRSVARLDDRYSR